MNFYKIFAKDKLIIKAKALWDGVSDTLTNKSVIIADGRIREVTDYIESVQGYKELSLSDLTLLPGLIDCHVHLAFDSQNLQETIKEWSQTPSATYARIKKWMTDSLRYGVTAVRDGGDLMQFGLSARNMQATGEIMGPKVVATGSAIYRKGKYGNFLGPGINTFEDAKEQIDQLIEKQVNQIKLVLSGLVSFKEYGVVGKPQFVLEELDPIVKYAHSRGMRIMAHASSDEAVALCVKAGVDSVEHGYFVSSESLKKMADSNTAWVPTIAPLGNLVKLNHLPYPGAKLEVIKRTYEEHLISINKAFQLGVNLGIGTDAGANQVYHGASYHDELNFYLDAGLQPFQVLTSATINSAKIIGMEAMGKIKPGYIPTLIAVRGNPLQDLKALEKVEVVFFI